METDPLDRAPAGAHQAAIWLRQLADIARRTELQYAAQRLTALARWADGLGHADRELLEKPAEAPARDVLAEQPPAVAHTKVRGDVPTGVVAALAKGPMVPSKIAKALDASEADVKRWLKLARKDGLVRRVGYRWSLVDPPVPAEPVRSLADVVTVPRATPHATTGGGPTCTRCDCSFSDHDPNSGKCYGKKGKCVCTEFYS